MDKSIVLYSNHCPKCKILEAKLKSKNISFEEVNDVVEMENLGFVSMPMMEVNGITMNFIEANSWVNQQEVAA